MYRHLTDACRFAVKDHDVKLDKPRELPLISTAELSEMMDMDMASTKCVEVMEVHHLAWSFSRVCAVRPGSIAASTADHARRGLFLKWKDIVLLRSDSKGQFEVKLTFRSMKGHNGESGRQTKPFQVHVLPPQCADNLILSIPHRLLVIGLRRGVFEGIETLDDVFNKDNHQFIVKTEFLDCPILLGSGPRGLSVTDAPVTAVSLTQYLQLRASWAGYGMYCTMYSIRHASLTIIAARLGMEYARMIAGHAPGTTTLERYYMHLHWLDISGASLGEHSENPGVNEPLRTKSSLAMQKLNAEELEKLQGPALNEIIIEMMATNEYPYGASLAVQKNWRRRASRAAYQTLLAEKVEQTQIHRTHTEFSARMDLLEQSGNFAKKVITDAKALMERTPAADTEVPGMDLDGFFSVPKNAVPLEEDLEDTAETDVPISRSTDDCESRKGGKTDVETARSFMEILFGNTSIFRGVLDNQRCPRYSKRASIIMSSIFREVLNNQRGPRYSEKSSIIKEVLNIYRSLQYSEDSTIFGEVCDV